MMDKVTRYPVRTMFRRSLLAGAMAVSMSACGAPDTPAETELRDWVSRGVEAAEARERRKLVDMISPAYADARGNEREAVEEMLRFYFLRMNSVELITSIDEINVIGDSAAELSVTVGMAGTHDGVLGFSADAYRFALEVEQVGGDWQLISARWGEVGKELR